MLDALWWVLTTTWAGEKAFPWRPLANLDGQTDAKSTELKPRIEARLTRRGEPRPFPTEIDVSARWKWESQEWLRQPWRPNGDEAKYRPTPLVIYARTDGGFAIWDAYNTDGHMSGFEDAAIVLDKKAVWDGRHVPDSTLASGERTEIPGLISDWVRW